MFLFHYISFYALWCWWVSEVCFVFTDVVFEDHQLNWCWLVQKYEYSLSWRVDSLSTVLDSPNSSSLWRISLLGACVFSCAALTAHLYPFSSAVDTAGVPPFTEHQRGCSHRYHHCDCYSDCCCCKYITVCVVCCVSDRAGVALPHHGPAGVLLPLRPAAKRLPRCLQTEHQR